MTLRNNKSCQGFSLITSFSSYTLLAFPKYTYAVLATLLAVVAVLILARLAARIGGEAAISNEAEG